MRGEQGVAFLRASPGVWVLALAFPILCVHVDFQPGWDTTVGSTHAHIVLSDLAVIACVVAAIAVAARDGLGPLRRGIPAPGSRSAPFSCWIAAATVYPLRGSDPYPWHTHVVTTGKYVEYALLAPAVVLLIRQRRRPGAVPLLGGRHERGRLDAGRRPVLRLAHRQGLAGRLPAAGVPGPSGLRRAVGHRAGDRAGGRRRAGVAHRPAAGRRGRHRGRARAAALRLARGRCGARGGRRCRSDRRPSLRAAGGRGRWASLSPCSAGSSCSAATT